MKITKIINLKFDENDVKDMVIAYLEKNNYDSVYINHVKENFSAWDTDDDGNLEIMIDGEMPDQPSIVIKETPFNPNPLQPQPYQVLLYAAGFDGYTYCGDSTVIKGTDINNDFATDENGYISTVVSAYGAQFYNGWKYNDALNKWVKE